MYFKYCAYLKFYLETKQMVNEMSIYSGWDEDEWYDEDEEELDDLLDEDDYWDDDEPVEWEDDW